MKMIRRLSLGEPEANDWVGTTPEQRLAAVRELTRAAYAFGGEGLGEGRVQRDVVRVIRSHVA